MDRLTPVDLLTKMSTDLGLLPKDLHSIIQTAPLRYKVFDIPKRAGGQRQIAQPAREVKAIQRWIISFLRPIIPIHEAATAYQDGASIRNNAERHKESNYILKMDFQNFFPSIEISDIKNHLTRYCGSELEAASINLIAQACAWAPSRETPLRLCIGAPSSPLLSNSVMFDFDRVLTTHDRSRSVSYTRYADDITFSAEQKGNLNYILDDMPDILRSIEYPSLSINKKKTVFASRAGRRVVTGITLTPDHKLSIGRERKRRIRAMYHRFSLGQLSEDEQQKLEGLMAFAEDIEPGFKIWLERSVRN